MKNYEVIYQAIERGILKGVYEAGDSYPARTNYGKAIMSLVTRYAKPYLF